MTLNLLQFVTIIVTLGLASPASLGMIDPEYEARVCQFSLTHPRVVDLLIQERTLQLKLNEVGNLREEVVDEALRNYEKEGRYELSLLDTETKILNTFHPIKNAGGINNHGMFLSSDERLEGKILKKLSNLKTHQGTASERALREYFNARIIYEVGLGPEVHLVHLETHYYLVLEKLPGINVKELFRHNRTVYTEAALEEMLPFDFLGDHDSKEREVSRQLVEDPLFEARLEEVADILQQVGFVKVEDVQFMVDLNISTSWMPLIDSGSFKRYSMFPYTPKQSNIHSRFDSLYERLLENSQ